MRQAEAEAEAKMRQAEAKMRQAEAKMRQAEAEAKMRQAEPPQSFPLTFKKFQLRKLVPVQYLHSNSRHKG
jgi:multidrug resistance efflux pump